MSHTYAIQRQDKKNTSVLQQTDSYLTLICCNIETNITQFLQQRFWNILCSPKDCDSVSWTITETKYNIQGYDFNIHLHVSSNITVSSMNFWKPPF
jgi:thiamine pyrophosphokinase